MKNLSQGLQDLADELLKLYTPEECEVILTIAKYKEILPEKADAYIFNKIKTQFAVDVINSTFKKLQVNKLVEDNTESKA